MSTPYVQTPAAAELERIRGRASSLRRWHRGTPDAVEAERDLAAALLAARVREIVDRFPPITAEQASRVVALLRVDGDDPG